MAIPWILISVGILIILLVVLAIIFSKGKKHEPDYFAFFIMGIVWLPTGVFFNIFIPENSLGLIFMGLGITYTIIGLVHRDKWKTNRKQWKQLSNKEQKLKIIISIILGILVLFGLVAYYFFRG